MTAELITFPSEAERVDQTIRSTIRALMEGRGLAADQLAPRVGVSVATLYRKLSDKDRSPFKAHEVSAIARELAVTA